MSLALHYWMRDARHCSGPPVSEMTYTTGPPFPGSAIPTVRALGLGLGIGLVLGLGLGGPREWRTPGMADRNRVEWDVKLYYTIPYSWLFWLSCQYLPTVLLIMENYWKLTKNWIIITKIYQNIWNRNTVKLRIEAPGFYQYKLVRPLAYMQGPASIRGPACIITCQVCVILVKKSSTFTFTGYQYFVYFHTKTSHWEGAKEGYKVCYIS